MFIASKNTRLWGIFISCYFTLDMKILKWHSIKGGRMYIDKSESSFRWKTVEP